MEFRVFSFFRDENSPESFPFPITNDQITMGNKRISIGLGVYLSQQKFQSLKGKSQR